MKSISYLGRLQTRNAAPNDFRTFNARPFENTTFEGKTLNKNFLLSKNTFAFLYFPFLPHQFVE
jgi:hypothetical protein